MKLHKKLNVIELVENVKKNEDLYEDEKEYFRMLLKKIEENHGILTENEKVEQNNEKGKELIINEQN